MASKSSLSALLSREEEPSQSDYYNAVRTVVHDLDRIERLTEDSVKDAILLQLTTRGHRLARFFDDLHRLVRTAPSSSTTFRLATGTTNFLTSILPDLDHLLEPKEALKLLVPALEVCFAPSQTPALRKLAAVRDVARSWSTWPPIALAVELLADMVSSCQGYHNVAPSIQQWATLIALKRDLHNLEAEMLDEEDKRASFRRGQVTDSPFLPLDDAFKVMLKTFDLAEPESRRMVQSHIGALRSSKIPTILRSIVTSFPCKRCVPALGSTTGSTNTEIRGHSIATISNLHLNVLGKAIGVWKVLLSGPALKSIQNLSQLSLFSLVKEKLIDLAAGCWKSSLAGSDDQRKHLKVPVASTKCRPDLAILWQVDIGIAEDVELLQQVIVVWQVGNQDVTSKAIDQISHLQRGYTDEIVRRCRQRPSILDGKQIPARFDSYTLSSATPRKPSAEFDVRTVDQDTIDMANKFYALTKPVIQSILDKDLAAEFPFDLSIEETRVITHFQSASLILGRSGTGKTTCLVFKLVGKLLASKAVLDERPIRQVLLTRSNFLVDKLEVYTRRLIETLSSKSASPAAFEAEEHLVSRTIEQDSNSDSVLTLRDHSFPLICTFDRFLQILENTVIESDRQNFGDLEAKASLGFRDVPSTERPHQGQLVDFYAFKVDYWPRFSENLTKDLSVNLVFAEIMGVIKGSVSSRESLAPISREEYLTRSCRMAPIFVSEAERLRVYDIFGLYEKLKVERGDVDYIDRVVKMLGAVRRDLSLRQLLQSTFDEVYIDEIQDQRCLDIELFLSFLKDGRGFHFAGDTAQAISHDSTFRFSDIKRLFYEHFAEASASTKQSDLAEPRMFTLSKNYRSHQGILALASLVMSMIWKGFPETVDKLDPEVGYLNGPKPVLFLGCDVDILRSRNVGSVKSSERAADFGAEQVILVRDTKSKQILQDQVGDVALILTILESKGMEFDDVILWNFFSECPDQVGVRSLIALKNDVDGFDARKHGGMCPELKHLYVAITRARSQLSIVEGSEPTEKPILKLLTEGPPGPLVEVIRPDDESFIARVESLRPSTSVDPARWFQRADEFMRRHMFKDALLAFRRAKDTRGETKAQAFLKEEAGNLCDADNDTEGFTRNMRLAIDYFLELDMIGDTVRILVRLGELEEAAEIWLQCKQYLRAAPLFTDAQLHIKAADCYHHLQHHTEAAASLLEGSHYDRLVVYVDKYKQSLPSDTLRRYNLLCKLLLKQNKISVEYRKHAISLLGSLDKQEACFLEYGMDEELADLYTNQKRHKDLYDLFCRTAQLEKALDLGLSKILLQSTARIPEPQLLTLLDYVWAGQMTKKRHQDFATAFKLRSDHLTPNVIRRIEQWGNSHHIYSAKDASINQNLANREDSFVKKILTLQKIIDATAVPKISRLDDLPFGTMQAGVGIVKDIVLKDDVQAIKVVFVLTGIWTLGGPQERYVLLPWSPFYGTLKDLSTTDIRQVAKKWILDKTASTMLAMDSRARVLFNSKWRVRCSHYLTTGICRQRNCQRSHQDLSQDDCSRILDDMVRVNIFCCDFATLYYRRVMSTIFQKEYLGIRRHWLERLLRELTFLSATEQSASAIAKAQEDLLRSNKSFIVRSSLEGLLYFRLGSEWKERSNFTSLLEQMQTAEAFGSTVRSRLFRALSNRLYRDNRDSTQRHLNLLNGLKLDPNVQNASQFQKNLEFFLRDLENHEIRAFRSLHSFTAVLESLATFLILKTCVTASVLTQSWIDLYRPSINMAVHSLELLEWTDRYRYQQCLIQLTESFCRVMCRLRESPSKINHLCSGKPHEAQPLQRRNAEFVAILIANMATMPPVPAHVWASAKEIFTPDKIGAIRRQTISPAIPGEIIQKLTPSLLNHNSKDALIVVVKDRKKGLVFSNLEGHPGVKTVPFDQLCPPTPKAVDAGVAVNPTLPVSTNNPQGDYTPAEKDAVAKIKKSWLLCSLKIKRRRSYISLPECRAITQFFNMGAQCPATMTHRDRTAMRKLLVSQGVSLSLRLDAARELLSRLQKDAMSCVANVDVSVTMFESVDVALGRIREIETLLKKAEEKMSDGVLEELTKRGVPSALEAAMRDSEGMVFEAEKSLLETKTMIDAVHCCETAEHYLEALESYGKVGLALRIIEEEKKGGLTQIRTMTLGPPDAAREACRQLSFMLYWMNTPLLKAIIQGQLPRLAAVHSGEVCQQLWKLNNQEYLQPGTYMNCICNCMGMYPTPAQWIKVCSLMLKYVQADDEYNDLAELVDQQIHPKHSWPKDLAHRGLRRYTEWQSHVEKGSYHPDSTHRKWVRYFVDQLKIRMTGQPLHAPLSVPVVEIGFSNDPYTRLRQHRHHESSNYLMNLAEAVFKTEYPGVFHLQQNIIYACFRPIQTWLSEIILTQLAQGYVDGGDGFSHEVAGCSNGASNQVVPVRMWNAFEAAVYADGRFKQEMEASVLARTETLRARQALHDAREVYLQRMKDLREADARG